MARAAKPIQSDDQALISELSQTVLLRAAPEELLVFDETAQEYRPHVRSRVQATPLRP